MLLALISAASAGSRIVTGPYNITFDLNTPKNYTVEITPPLPEDNYTSYSVLINVSNTTRTGIYIWDLKTPEDATPLTNEQIYRAYAKDLQNSSVELGKIDGKDGIIAHYIDHNNRPVFQGKYWLDSKKIDNTSLYEGSIEIGLYGTMPRNSTEDMAITKSFISTLHIEKTANLTAKTVVPTVGTEPYISVRDQDVEDNHGYAIIDEAFSDGPGWVAIYDERYVPNTLSSPMGYAHLNDGLNKYVKVQLNMAKVTPKLFAVLHKDAGTLGIFEYPGPDYPFDPRAVEIYSFYSKSPHPFDDLRINWRNHMSAGPNWM